MHVICKDGTTIQCQHFRAIDSGVLIYEGSSGTAEEAEEGEEAEEEMDFEEHEATGFVPITELRFVLPDQVVQSQAGAQRAGQPGRAQGAGGQHRQPTQYAQQQQMQQHPGGPGQSPYGSGGQ